MPLFTSIAKPVTNPSGALLRWLLRPVILLGLTLFAGCASTQTSDAAIPSAGRPMWSQCSAPVTAWCHRQGQGDPTLDRDCEENSAREYRRLADDDARRRYLTAHACTL